MSKKINIRPTSSVYGTYKRLSYQPWTAIAEFVDNSSQSYFDHTLELEKIKNWKSLEIEIIYEEDSRVGDRLIIRDNAFGMEWDDFERAILLDKPPFNKTGRNEFGMGLKTASCWFGSKWVVESTRLGSSNKYKALVDVNMLEKYRTEEIDVHVELVDSATHGTTITITGLNRKIMGRTIGKVKSQLRGIYRSDIRSERIKIFFNGELLNYQETKILTETLSDGTIKVWQKPINFSIEYEGKKLEVSGFIALRNPASVKEAGFTLLRRGRVIIGSFENNYRPREVFEDSNSYIYQRLIGELNMDNWPVTQAKDTFDWYNNDLEERFIDELIIVTKDYREKAKNFRVRTKTTIENGIKAFINKYQSTGVITNVELSPIKENNSILEELEQEFQNSKDDFVYDSTVQSDGIIIEGSRGESIKFDINETNYVFNMFLLTSDIYRNWLTIEKVGSEDNVYNIVWNIRHPFFKPYIDEEKIFLLMEDFIFAFALSEIEASKMTIDGKVSTHTIRTKMNQILKDVLRG